MKGFRDTTKTLSGHSFPASHGFSHSTGGTINRLAGGGPVPQTNPSAGNRMEGNSATQRKVSSTQELEEHGGKGPLTAGFARGGKAKHFHVHKHFHSGGKTRSVTHSYSAAEKHAEQYAAGGPIHDNTSIPAGSPDYKKGGVAKKPARRAARKNAGGALYATGGTINKLAGGGLPTMALRGPTQGPRVAPGALATGLRGPPPGLGRGLQRPAMPGARAVMARGGRT